MIKECLICKKKFVVKFNKKCSTRNKYCSRQCYWKTLKNKKLSKEHIEKLRILHIGKMEKESFHWKGGKTKRIDGYILIYQPTHPFPNRQKYVLEHRIVIEKQIGRYLLPEETGHHINEIRDDNRPENLMAFTSKSAHTRFHYNPDNVKSKEIIFDGRKL